VGELSVGRSVETRGPQSGLCHCGIPGSEDCCIVLIGSWALTSVALFPAALDTRPQSPVRIDFLVCRYEAGRSVPPVESVLAVKPSARKTLRCFKMRRIGSRRKALSREGAGPH
jgi:hypothetical protein